MSFYRWLFVVIALLGCHCQALAQGLRRTDPVQVSTAVLQASRHLSDYTDGLRDNIQVTLVNRNQDGMPLRIALRLAIETPNLSITTRPEAVLPVFDLDPGATLVLREADLAPYFLKNNLRLQGVMKNSDLLPDGLAKFSFQAVEFYSGTAVSQPGSTLAPLARATLPRLVAPAQNESFTYRTAGNAILFTWTPATYAGAQLRYEFHLVQLDDPYTAPEQAVNTPGLLRMSQSTPATSFQLLPSSDFPLQPGRTYAWYVRAAEVHDGVERSDAFQNNGYSEVRTFRVVEDCKAPSGIRVQTDKWTRSATLSWDKADSHTGFAVAYIGEERQNDDYSLWVEDHTQACSKTIANLKAGASYRFRVGAACQSEGSFVYTQPQTFTIPVLTEEDNAQCGQMPQRVVDDGLRLEALEPGDVVTIAGGFPMTVTAVNSPSPFNGEGYISTRLTGPVKIAVLFKNLTVNPDYRMTGGTVESAYDANGGLVYSLNRLNQGGVTQLKDGRILPDWELDFVIDPDCRLEVDTTAHPAALTFYNAAGQVLGTVRMGTDVAPVFPMTVKDADGNLFEITEETDEAGLPTGEYAFKPLGRFGGRLGPGDYVANTVSDEVAVVSFLAHPDARYTFDPFLKWYDDVLLLTHYGIYGNERAYARLALKGGGDYDVPWVFLPEGASDKVYATIEVNKEFKGDFDPAKVVFKTDEGYIAASEYDPQAKRYTVSVAAAQPGSRQMLHALYPKEGTQMHHLGRLDIDTRAEVTHQVCLVPMGGSYDRAAIEAKLNVVYNRIGAHWEVKEVTDFAPDAELTQGLFDKESSKLTSYNDKMAALNKALRRWLDDRYDANTAYVFLFNDATGDSGKESAGFMPLGCQFAYINCAKAGDVARTVAHELGHGCFQLRHPFDDAYGSSNTRERERTDFLMGYNDGSHLPKWQWDMVYAPAVFKPLVKEDKDGEMSRDAINIITEKYTKVYIHKCSEATHFSLNPELTTPSRYNATYHCIGLNQSGQLEIKDIPDVELNKIFDEDFYHSIVDVSRFVECPALNPIEDFCEIKSIDDDDVRERILQNLQSCNEQKSSIEELQEQFCKNIRAEIRLPNGKYYYLKDGVVQESTLSDTDIRNGIWDDSDIDVVIRVDYNQEGYVTIHELGFGKNMPVMDGKTLDKVRMANRMKESGNQWLIENNVKDINQTLQINISPLEYAGEMLYLAKDAFNERFGHYISAGIEQSISLAKTGEYEQAVYLKDEISMEYPIKIPTILTGSSETVIREVTDITELCYMAYGLVTDKEIRTQTWEGIKQVSVMVKDDPHQFFPILGDLVLEEVSGIDSGNQDELSSESTDIGRKRHLQFKCTTRTCITAAKLVIGGGDFYKSLPKIAARMCEKVDIRKGIKKLTKSSADELAEQLGKKIKSLPDDVGQRFIEDFGDASEDVIERFLKNPELVDSWKRLRKIGVNEKIFKDVDALEAWINLESVSVSKVAPSVMQPLKTIELTDDEIGKLISINRKASLGQATKAEIKLSQEIAEVCFDVPTKGEKITKYVSVEDFDEFHLNAVNKQNKKSSIGGFIAKESDYARYNTNVPSNQLMVDFGLTYEGSLFSANKGYVKIETEVTDEMMTSVKQPHLVNDAQTKFSQPQTFTGSLGHPEVDKITPEFYIDGGRKEIKVGAKAIEYDANGNKLKEWEYICIEYCDNKEKMICKWEER